MSFLIPRINSKNRKEALRAFKVAYKDDAALDAMLRRDDIVIKDEVFSLVRGWHWKLYRSILNDPTHPYHAEAHRILNEENAEKGILDFDLPEIMTEEENGQAQIVMSVLRQGLEDLSAEYPQYVTLSIKERRKQP